jgi:hypothetical protein
MLRLSFCGPPLTGLFFILSGADRYNSVPGFCIDDFI